VFGLVFDFQAAESASICALLRCGMVMFILCLIVQGCGYSEYTCESGKTTPLETAVATHSNVASAEDCATDCCADPSCVATYYLSGTQDCALYHVALASSAVPGSGEVCSGALLSVSRPAMTLRQRK
jgi:hypothetical protein